MAPMKFEEQLKEKLEQRKLQPSSDAWSKLNSQLDEHAKTKNNKGFWWIGIAASFIGILFVVATLINRDEIPTVDTNIVDVETKEEPIENSSAIEKATKDQLTTTEALEEPKKDDINKTQKELPLLGKKQDELIKPKESRGILAQTFKKDILNEKETKSMVSKEAMSIEDKKILEVVAQVEKIKAENNTVTEFEINALLDAAQKEITLERMMKTDGKTVDANALLESVEMDLDRSFRERAFKAIKAGYKYVKTAVAERNN